MYVREYNVFVCNTEDIILNHAVWRINLFIVESKYVYI